jgi:hypothetical protein
LGVGGHGVLRFEVVAEDEMPVTAGDAAVIEQAGKADLDDLRRQADEHGKTGGSVPAERDRSAAIRLSQQ